MILIFSVYNGCKIKFCGGKKMNKITLNVEGMTCEHCEKRVTDALMSASGIKKVKAKAKKNIVEIKFDESQVSEDTIKSIIKETGYEVK